MKQQGKRKEKQSAIRSVRVSHPDQVEDGISLDAQAVRIAASCTIRDLAVSGHSRLWFSDSRPKPTKCATRGNKPCLVALKFLSSMGGKTLPLDLCVDSL